MKSIFFFMVCLSVVNASQIGNDEEDDALRSSGSISQIDSQKMNKEISKLYQDVDGHEDDYLRCSICLFRFTGNTSQTLSKLSVIGSTVLTGIVAIPDLLDDKTRLALCASAGICQIASVALLSFKSYSNKAIVEREIQLKEVLISHGVQFEDD